MAESLIYFVEIIFKNIFRSIKFIWDSGNVEMKTFLIVVASVAVMRIFKRSEKEREVSVISYYDEDDF